MARSITAPGPRRFAPNSSWPALGILRPLSGAVRLLRAGFSHAWQRRRMRIALLAAVIALPLLGGVWLWVRQSPFVAVQRVHVSGVSGPEASAIDTALVAAARQMSTLDVHAGALRAATAAFPVVREVTAVPRFPHGLDVHVVEQLPVAALVVGGARTAVAADGVVLGPSLLSSSLPTISSSYQPPTGKRLHATSLLAALTVMGAAPAPLARLAERVFTGPKGLTVAMRSGLLVYFGEDSRPHAKWLSLARVLADSSSAGAAYVDVRLPGHPAAGFPPGVQPPAAGSAVEGSSEPVSGSTESTVASLAAGLTRGTGIEPSNSASGSATPEKTSEASSETPPAEGSETSAPSEPEAAPGSSTPGG
jgi:cell division protein FtsQ